MVLPLQYLILLKGRRGLGIKLRQGTDNLIFWGGDSFLLSSNLFIPARKGVFTKKEKKGENNPRIVFRGTRRQTGGGDKDNHNSDNR